jgi:hypothetical protein
MTPILSSLMKSSRVALVALTLGAAAVTAMPAQAQSFSFQLGIGNGGDVLSFGLGNRRGFHPIRVCLTDRQVIRGLRHFGLRNIDIIDHISRNRVLVEATFHGRDYRFKVNKCTGQVYDVRRLKKHKNYDDGFNDDDYGTGFGFGMRFGDDNGY